MTTSPPGPAARQPARRVLFVQVTADRYGSDRSLVVLAQGLHERGWDVTVVVPYHGPLVDDLVRAGATVEVGPVGALRRVYSKRDWVRFALVELPVSTFRIARAARHADIVHVNSAPLLGGGLGGRLGRRPVVWHIRESFQGMRWRPYARVMGWLATVVIANSSAIAAEASAAGLGAKTRMIHNGVPFGLPPSFPISGSGVVAVGRINSWKGHDVLVDAAAILRDRRLPIPVAIAGDVYPGGEMFREALERQVSRLEVGDRISLLGFVDDVDRLLTEKSIFVLASRRPEPFGLALVEAMGHGLACIATAHGGPMEIVDDGVTGLLVPPDDPVALADAIERLWSDAGLRERLGRAAAVDVRRRFNADRVVEQVALTYGELLGATDG